MKKLIKVFELFLFPSSIILLWELSVNLQWLPPSLSASPSEIFLTLIELLTEGNILKQVGLSLYRLFVGSVIGIALGCVVGIALSYFGFANRIFSPTLVFLAPIPVVVWIPFMIMFFGTGELFKISLTIVVSFFIVYINTYQAAISIEKNHLEISDMYEKNFLQKATHVLFPYSLPNVFTSIRISLALSWVIIFFVEYGTADQGIEGLGWFIQDARAMGKINYQFAGVVILAITGYLLDKIIFIIQKNTLKWSDTVDNIIF